MVWFSSSFIDSKVLNWCCFFCLCVCLKKCGTFKKKRRKNSILNKTILHSNVFCYTNIFYLTVLLGEITDMKNWFSLWETLPSLIVTPVTWKGKAGKDDGWWIKIFHANLLFSWWEAHFHSYNETQHFLSLRVKLWTNLCYIFNAPYLGGPL